MINFLSKIRRLKNVPIINFLINADIKEIHFCDNFNQSVNKLHQLINSITFNDKFNQSVDKLPQSSTC
jgi:hypothetical protein